MADKIAILAVLITGSYNVIMSFSTRNITQMNSKFLLLTGLLVTICSLSFGQAADSIKAHVQSCFQLRQLYVPEALVLTGIATNSWFKDDIKYRVVAFRNEYMPDFHTDIENYLQYLPIPVAYGLDAFGVRSKTDIANRTAILIKSQIIMMAATNIVKYSTRELRPDSTARNSFPSGHTAEAFMAAAFVSEEYKYRYKWMPYAAYGVATSVGVFRMANNRHYISDVLLGAGFGILSVKATYWTHRYVWGHRHKAR
jgi:membrane-associated phospholipid phosphatase